MSSRAEEDLLLVEEENGDEEEEEEEEDEIHPSSGEFQWMRVSTSGLGFQSFR